MCYFMLYGYNITLFETMLRSGAYTAVKTLSRKWGLKTTDQVRFAEVLLA